MTRRIIVSSIIAGLVVAAAPAAAVGPTEFIDARGNEWTVAVDTDVVAWATSSTKSTYVTAVKVREGTDPGIRISKTGTAAYVGNIELGGSHGDVVLFFQGANKGRGQWDAKLWDLGSDSLQPLPSGINTSKDEIYGGISGQYLLFTRGASEGDLKTVLLYRFDSDSFTTLAEAPKGGSVTANSIAGDYATYTVCPRSYECNVFRYQISTEDRTKMPNSGRANYYSSVLSDGTVYYVSGSPKYCGYKTSLVRVVDGGGPIRLARLPNGIESGPTSAWVDPISSDPTLYFTRIQCRHFRTGIWQLPG